jgi:hypothetical protein
MIGLLRKSSFFYISHLVTFCWLGVAWSFQGEYGWISAVSAMVPLWMSSSVLWAEQSEKYRFLRILPITSSEIVAVKLSLILAAATAYLGILTTSILIAGDRAGNLPVNLSTAVFCCFAGLLLAFIWQICIWRFGIRIMTPVILVAIGMQFLLIFAPLVTRRRASLVGVNEIKLFQTLSEPLWFVSFLVTAGTVIWGIWWVAIQVFERTDAGEGRMA